MLFWVPQRAQIGLGISILSFGGELLIGLIADTRVVSEPKALVGAFEAEFRELREAAGV